MGDDSCGSCWDFARDRPCCLVDVFRSAERIQHWFLTSDGGYVMLPFIKTRSQFLLSVVQQQYIELGSRLQRSRDLGYVAWNTDVRLLPSDQLIQETVWSAFNSTFLLNMNPSPLLLGSPRHTGPQAVTLRSRISRPATLQ